MKANEFDKKIKDQVKKVEHAVPTHVTWDINKSWDKLSQLLKQASPKSLVWYLSLAASVSMVMANVSLIDYEWSDDMPEHSIQPKTSLLSNNISELELAEELQPPTQSDPFMVVNPKTVTAIPTITLAQTQANFTPLIQHISEPRNAFQKSYFKPQLNASITTSGARFSGELILITNKRIKNASLGMSLEVSSQIFNTLRQEAALSNQSRQSIYMNMVVLNDQGKRPWSARIGTPLWQTNPSDSTAPMIKMNYQTKLGKRMYIGPEVIISKGFNHVYPGISLSFG
ncbi:MAG: hypothetical protein RIF33_24455 [Cyclobacteriaceae bacterium]